MAISLDSSFYHDCVSISYSSEMCTAKLTAIPNRAIIKYIYGKIDVKTMGSEKRTNAVG